MEQCRGFRFVEGQLQNSCEVRTGAMRNDSKPDFMRDIAFIFEKAVYDLVERAVTAHGNNGLRTAFDRRSREFNRMVWRSCLNSVDVTRQMLPDLRPGF